MDKTGISALKRKINRTLYCARMFFLLNILFCTAATCLIVSKVFFGYDPDLRIYLWIVSGLTGVSIVGGGIAAWGIFYSYSDAALILDYYGNYRHIFWIFSSMPSEQGNAWLQKMETRGAGQPQVFLNRPLMAKKVMPALLLTAAALAVPVNEQAAVHQYSGTVIEEELEKKEKMAAELEKAGALSQEELSKIQKEIEEVRSRKSRRFSHERWEAIDGIGERIVNKARDAVGLKNWAGASARELAMHLESGQRSVSRLAKKSEELAKALRTLAGQGKFTSLPSCLESVLGKNGSRLLDKNAPFDPKLLNNKELLKELDKFLSDSLSREKITKYLETQKETAYRLSKKGGGGMPGPGDMGSGGIDRGRGDAPMVWGDTSDRSGTETQKRILPSGFRDPHNQALIGVGLSLPQVKYVEDIRSGTDIPVSPTEGDRSWKRDISPAHRKIVRDYFKE